MSNRIVPCETIDTIKFYIYSLIKWNKNINLISAKSKVHIVNRHIYDSLQLSYYVENQNIIDIGSGAGLPGILLSIINPSANMFLIESDKRKCAFLNYISQALSLDNISVKNTRVEVFDFKRDDIIVSRACASLKTLCDYVLSKSNEHDKCVFLKGASLFKELTEAQQYNFSYRLTKCYLDNTGYTITMCNIEKLNDSHNINS